jgi:hypothetical protein
MWLERQAKGRLIGGGELPNMNSASLMGVARLAREDQSGGQFGGQNAASEG